MEEEEDEETLSSSDSDYSNDDYSLERGDEGGHGRSSGGNTSDESETCSAVSSPSVADWKSNNVDGLVRGNLVVRRQPLLPRMLSVSEGAAVCRKPFKPPCPSGYDSKNGQLSRRLWARKRFVPWGSLRPALVALPNKLDVQTNIEINGQEEVVNLPPGIDPLILWEPEESEERLNNLKSIVVDPLLVRFLRPHQREGVQFMFDCVSGLYSSANINGCILADDMGLGKTLQSITLLYTLLCEGFDGKPMVKKAIVVTPTSLVSNWDAEIKKWVGERVQLIALCESTKEDVVSGIDHFTHPRSSLQVLIVSYETFRMHSSKFSQSESCDLLICDEAHRLKNDQTLTNRALAALPCKRRILLSGTPMQNDLEEFFAMVNFTNPGILGDAAYFRHYYETPIVYGREPTATEEEKALAAERSAELSSKVNQFILRRTNTLLSNHLPPKIIEVVCCKMMPLQSNLYNHFISSKNFKRAISDEAKQSKVLAYITALKKLCNHPKLIYDTIKSGSSGTTGFEDCLQFFPPEMFSGRSGSWTGGNGAWVELSGKMHVLARLLANLRRKTDDRIVLVSNYTQTLDLFAQLCRERRYPYLRLDGTTTISKRQKLVNRFNDTSKDEFAFLLSSKAGGCGLNLIGGNRLVLFDPDWNPANDKQAAARVWRDGQKKRVYVYRFLSSGTIEEKVYQRQMSKEGLQKVIQQEQADSIRQGNFLSIDDLRDLFSFHGNARSEIHEKMSCTRCPDGDDGMGSIEERDENEPDDNTWQTEQQDIGGFAEIAGCLHLLKSSQKQVGSPLEEDLASWGHHFTPKSVPDSILQASAGDEAKKERIYPLTSPKKLLSEAFMDQTVSIRRDRLMHLRERTNVTFVFTNQVEGKLLPVESKANPRMQEGETKAKVSPAKPNHSLSQRSNMLPRIRKPLQPLSSDEVTARTKLFSCKPLQGNSLISDKVVNRNPGNNDDDNTTTAIQTFGKKLPLKRPCADSAQHDDDFV